MSKLRELQQDFSATLLRHEPPASDAMIVQSVQEGELSFVQRFTIYRNNSLQGIGGVLESIYCKTARLIGSDAFEKIAHEFVCTHLPRAGNMNRYGKDFPAYFWAQMNQDPYPYLLDLMQFEQDLNRAYYIDLPSALDPTYLASLPPEQHPSIVFEVNPSVSLQTSQFDLGKIISKLRDGATLQESDLQERQNFLYWVITQQQLEVVFNEVSAGEYAFLKASQSQKTFEQSTEAAFEKEAEFDLMCALKLFYELDLFTDNTRPKE